MLTMVVRDLWQFPLAAMTLLMTSGTAPGADGVPPFPDKPWYPPQLRNYEAELARGGSGRHWNEAPSPIDPQKVYTLSELIDVAQRTHPQTRIAWERACQAAAAVGLSQSAYFPYLIATAGAGYERAFIPFPTLKQGPGPADVSITGGGTLTSEAAAERAAIGLKWLLFDFGERKAVERIAKEGLISADVGFNSVHQQLIFAVTRRYYELNSARQRVEASEASS